VGCGSACHDRRSSHPDGQPPGETGNEPTPRTTDTPAHTSDQRLAALAVGCGAATTLLGAIGIAGWTLHVSRLKSFAPGLGEIKVNAAIGLVLVGAAALLHLRGRTPRISRVLGALAAVIGALTVIEYVLGVDLGIDQLLFTTPEPARSALAPGRMGLNTALCLALGGGALIVPGRRERRSGWRWPALAALAIAGLSLLSLIGYVFGAPRLEAGFIGRDLARQSLQSTAALALLAGALWLAHPREAPLALLRSAGAGGRLMRHMLVAVVVLPILLGWLRLEGQDAGLYATAEGVALYCTALIVLFVPILWRSAQTIERYDRELRGQELRWQAILRSDRLGVLVRDAGGRLVECNDRLAEILGTTPAALIGTTAADIMAPAEAEAVERERAGLTAPDTSRAFPQADRAITLRDGRRVSIRVTACMIPSADGEPGSAVFLVDDLTERKQMEDELAHARRIESIGRLAAGIGHELNNKLAIVLGFNQRVAKRLGSDDAVRADLAEIRGAAEHAAALTQNLLAFGRQQMLEQRPIVVGDVVAGIARILDPALGPQIELVIDDRSGGAQVLGDRAQLEQVLVNLAVNAQEAMPRGGRITLTTACTTRAEPGHSRWVTVAVADTGHGIAPEIHEQVFEPFFTTKEFGHGAGLGLSTALGIVEQSGGTITIDSPPGRGVTATIELPALAPAESPPAGAPRPVTVLLVEDDEPVREIIALMLRDAGLLVSAAGGATEALDVLASASPAIDVLATDIVLGDVHGGELARRARALDPALRVLYISGYDGEAVIREDMPHGDGFLTKPFTPQELLGAIRATLAAAPNEDRALTS
jgi:PAS domain S-box-containing protein